MKANGRDGARVGIRQGVVVVVHRGGRFLMIRRASGVRSGGAWCFVGGAIEPGETQAEAVVREFAEEVGGRVHPLRKIWESRRPDDNLLLHWWLADSDGGALQANPREVDQLRWCTPDEVERLPRLLRGNLEFMMQMGRDVIGCGERRRPGGSRPE